MCKKSGKTSIDGIHTIFAFAKRFFFAKTQKCSKLKAICYTELYTRRTTVYGIQSNNE